MDEKAEKEFTGHTPGPWHVSENEWTAASDGWDVMTGPADSPLCVAADLRSGADARLIAAAPDLLRERDALSLQVATLESDVAALNATCIESQERERTLERERDEARRQRDALAEALVEIRRIIESPNAPWWMDSPDRGGFDLEAINTALAKAGRL